MHKQNNKNTLSTINKDPCIEYTLILYICIYSNFMNLELYTYLVVSNIQSQIIVIRSVSIGLIELTNRLYMLKKREFGLKLIKGSFELKAFPLKFCLRLGLTQKSSY